MGASFEQLDGAQSFFFVLSQNSTSDGHKSTLHATPE